MSSHGLESTFMETWVLECVCVEGILQPTHHCMSWVGCILAVPVTMLLWQGHSQAPTQSSLSEAMAIVASGSVLLSFAADHTLPVFCS